ncbi:putative toxin-antitoxin system toxin component, PIN family [Candidatus Roizmanbacteria bacterium]|nr:putative toxin-antitoxin system toxin component, PIN family [Candidatus Roizmanbacteria bacterium]
MKSSINLRVVVDTNVLISGLVWQGNPGKVIKLWQEDKFTLFISPYILAELVNFLDRVNASQKEKEIIINQFKTKSIRMIPPKKVKVCRDPKDNEILDLCLTSRADYLISGDKDLLILKFFKNTKILTPQEFLPIRKETS